MLGCLYFLGKEFCMVNSTVNQVVYYGDGITTAWPYTFEIIDATDIRLTILESDGTKTDVTSNYYVDVVNSTVYYPGYAPGSEPPEEDQPPKLQSGQKIRVYRKIPVNQLADLGEKWPFTVIEKGLDKLTMLIQDTYGWFESNLMCLMPSNDTEYIWDAKGYPIINVGGPTDVNDAATKDYVDRILTGIILDGDSRLVPFDTVAQLKAADLEAGQIAMTLGYWTINDDGAGVYNIRAKVPGDNPNDGTIIELTSDPSLVAELIIANGVINVKQFGAKGDGVTDDTAAIQAALDAVKDSGSVFFPKSGGSVQPHYYITDTLTVTHNDITIFAPPRSEYAEGLVTDQAITMLSVSGFGVTVQGLMFRGNGSTSAYGTTNGILFDRSSLGDAETYSNVDCTVRDCGFLFLNNCIKGRGRNVFVFDNIFSNCKVGIEGCSFVKSDSTTAEFRGWRITGNRFHSIGVVYDLYPATAPATLAALDSWCIIMPIDDVNMSHIEIADNNVDFGANGFYKGALMGVNIRNNFINRSTAPFIYSPMTNDLAGNLGVLAQEVSNNTVFFDRTRNVKYGFCKNSVIISNGIDTVFNGNFFKNSNEECCNLDTCRGFYFYGNYIENANGSYYVDSTTRPAFVIKDCEYIDVDGMTIRHQGGDAYSYGIKVETSSGVRMNALNILNSTLPVYVDDIGNISKYVVGTAWEKPSAYTNGFSYNAGNGYRKRFDGFIEIDLILNPGTDNAVAFTLPAGCRPTGDTYFQLAGSDIFGMNNSYVHIAAISGDVTVNYNSSTPSQCVIQIEFEAGN